VLLDQLDEDFWCGDLGLHKAIEGRAFGGVGDGVSPATALAVGLKVDVDALPEEVQEAIAGGEVDLNSPATTLALFKLNAVVGVTGFFNDNGRPAFDGNPVRAVPFHGRQLLCHVPPLFTEPGWNMHTPAEIAIDDFQANRAPDKRYRTPPLQGLFAHSKGGFFHDGRFATLLDVVNHYDERGIGNDGVTLGLTAPEKADLVEYLKSL